jgi:hypothetical protein
MTCCLSGLGRWSIHALFATGSRKRYVVHLDSQDTSIPQEYLRVVLKESINQLVGTAPVKLYYTKPPTLCSLSI